jgi:hypothetical protein
MLPKNRNFLVVGALLGCFLAGSCCPPVPEKKAVSVEKRDGYYFVTIDLTQGFTHHEIGVQYFQMVRSQVPGFLWRIGLYANVAQVYYGWSTSEIEKRIEDIRANLDTEYRDEIDGFIDGSYTDLANEPMPELFSIPDIVYFYQLMPDIARDSRCSAFAVWGGKSAQGSTICHRNLDWFGGILGELAGIQAITKIIGPNKTIYTIGGLGQLGCITGIDASTGNFGAILDADVEDKNFYTTGCRSYNFDLRHGLENFDTTAQIADYLKDPAKDYTFSHLIFLADATDAVILENNMSGLGVNPQRAVRTDTSILQSFISWPYTQMIGAVNCFMLDGQVDNYDQKFNTERWKLMQEQINNTLSPAGTLDFLGVQKIMTSFWGAKPRDFEEGDIYNTWTYQMMTYVPATRQFQVFFKPNRNESPVPPTFIDIEIK